MTRVIWTLSILAALAGNSALRAEENNCPAEDGVIPVLSKIPYISRLFKNVAARNECEQADHCAPVRNAEPCPSGECVFEVRPAYRSHIGQDGLERIGVDFEFDGPSAAGRCGVAKCAAEECACGPCEGGQCPARRAPAMAMLGTPVPFAVHHPLLAQLELLGEHNRQLMEALVEARVENAVLAARLEFADERQELLVENAVLKAQGAAPAAVAAHDSETSQLREENAALKAKLAALEERLAAMEQPVKKTAEKSSPKRKR